MKKIKFTVYQNAYKKGDKTYYIDKTKIDDENVTVKLTTDLRPNFYPYICEAYRYEISGEEYKTITIYDAEFFASCYDTTKKEKKECVIYEK